MMSTFLFPYWIAWFLSVPVLCRNWHFVLLPVLLKDRKKRYKYLIVGIRSGLVILLRAKEATSKEATIFMQIYHTLVSLIAVNDM